MPNFNSANWLIHLKRLSAICLFAAFFLPLTQCTQTSKREPTQQTTAQNQVAPRLDAPKFDAPKLDTQVFAMTADRDSITLSVANILTFIWPLCLVILIWLRPQLDERFSLRHVEILLCLLSVISLLRLTAFGELLPGGFLAWGALLTYSLITVLRLVSRTRLVWDR